MNERGMLSDLDSLSQCPLRSHQDINHANLRLVSMRGDSRPTDAYLEDVTENEPSFAAGLSARYKLLQHACTETRGDGLWPVLYKIILDSFASTKNRQSCALLDLQPPSLYGIALVRIENPARKLSAQPGLSSYVSSLWKLKTKSRVKS